VTAGIRQLLALWGGNVAAVHRELVARACSGAGGALAVDGPATPAPTPDGGGRDSCATSRSRPAGGGPGSGVPSLTALRRAIHRDLTAGERAGLAAGERAARKKDVFLSRPALWRNACWEADHVQVPVLVDIEGTARRPWVTWFIDCVT
jgi:putative transposase